MLVYQNVFLDYSNQKTKEHTSSTHFVVAFSLALTIKWCIIYLLIGLESLSVWFATISLKPRRVPAKGPFHDALGGVATWSFPEALYNKSINAQNEY